MRSADPVGDLKRKVKETTAAAGRSAFLFERRRLRPSGSMAVEP